MGNLLSCGEGGPPSAQQLINAIRKAGHTKKATDKDKAVIIFEKLMDAGNKDFTKYEDDIGMTAMIYSVLNDNDEMFILLLDNGADINIKDHTMKTALMHAASQGHSCMTQILMDHGAALNGKDKHNEQTALMWAVSYGHVHVAKLLLKGGADLSIRAKGEMTALMVAAETGYDDVVKMLLESGAENDILDLTNSTGQTAVMLAAHMGHASIVQQLVKKGANLDLKCHMGMTAVEYASSPEIVQILKGGESSASSTPTTTTTTKSEDKAEGEGSPTKPELTRQPSNTSPLYHPNKPAYHNPTPDDNK